MTQTNHQTSSVRVFFRSLIALFLPQKQKSPLTEALKKEKDLGWRNDDLIVKHRPMFASGNVAPMPIKRKAGWRRDIDESKRFQEFTANELKVDIQRGVYLAKCCLANAVVAIPLVVAFMSTAPDNMKDMSPFPLFVLVALLFNLFWLARNIRMLMLFPRFWISGVDALKENHEFLLDTTRGIIDKIEVVETD